MSNYSKRGDIEDVRAELAAVLMSESSQVDAACDAGCLSSPGSAYQDAPSSPGFSQTMPATAYLFGEGRRRSSGSLGSVGTDSPGSVQSVGSDGKPRRKSFQALFENIKGKMGLSPKKGSTKRKEGSTTHEEGKDDRSSCSGEEEEVSAIVRTPLFAHRCSHAFVHTRAGGLVFRRGGVVLVFGRGIVRCFVRRLLVLV